MAMAGEKIRYSADGLAMVGELFRPERPSAKPPVIVFPDGLGLGEQALQPARRLAERGHVALVSDLHGEQRRFGSIDEVLPILAGLRENVGRLRARATAALDALVEHAQAEREQVVASGYCFGGTMALELLRGGEPIAAAVGFHSGLGTIAPAAGPIAARVLVCIGADDPGIPPEQRAAFETEMRAAGADWQMHLYGGVVHSFTNREAAALGRPDFARYDAAADARSWRAFTDLLDELGD